MARGAQWRIGSPRGRLELALDPARLPADLAARNGRVSPRARFVAVVDHDPTPSRRFVTRAISSPRSSQTHRRGPHPGRPPLDQETSRTRLYRAHPLCTHVAGGGAEPDPRRGCGGGSGRGPERATRRAGARRSSAGGEAVLDPGGLRAAVRAGGGVWGTFGCGRGGGVRGPCSAFGMPVRARCVGANQKRSTVADEDGLINNFKLPRRKDVHLGDRFCRPVEIAVRFICKGTYVGQKMG